MNQMRVSASIGVPPLEPAAAFWYDGKLRTRGEIHVDPMTHALHYGTGVFEGIRSFDTPHGVAIFRLREHIERLFRSAETYGLRLAYDVETIVQATLDTLRASGLRISYLRPLVFFGEETFNLNPRALAKTHVMIAALPFNGLHSETARKGLRVTVSRRFEKTPSRALPSSAKGCGPYANSVLALHEAVERGFDEVLLLNDRGDIAEGSGENVFVVKDGRLRTNDLDADILLGITRATVIELAAELGIDCAIGPLAEYVVLDADEVFVTGTAAGIVPVAALDDITYATQRPVTARLTEAYDRVTLAQAPEHADWVAFV